MIHTPHMPSRINTTADGGKELNKEELSKLIDAEIDDFNLWFTSTFKGAGSLARFERSILKTYLMWKLDRT